ASRTGADAATSYEIVACRANGFGLTPTPGAAADAASGVRSTGGAASNRSAPRSPPESRGAEMLIDSWYELHVVPRPASTRRRSKLYVPAGALAGTRRHTVRVTVGPAGRFAWPRTRVPWGLPPFRL